MSRLQIHDRTKAAKGETTRQAIVHDSYAKSNSADVPIQPVQPQRLITTVEVWKTHTCHINNHIHESKSSAMVQSWRLAPFEIPRQHLPENKQETTHKHKKSKRRQESKLPMTKRIVSAPLQLNALAPRQRKPHIHTKTKTKEQEHSARASSKVKTNTTSQVMKNYQPFAQ